MKALAERVRWEAATLWDEDCGFKINNNHTAYIGRRLMAKHPQLAAYIETRRTRKGVA